MNSLYGYVCLNFRLERAIVIELFEFRVDLFGAQLTKECVYTRASLFGKVE